MNINKLFEILSTTVVYALDDLVTDFGLKQTSLHLTLSRSGFLFVFWGRGRGADSAHLHILASIIVPYPPPLTH